MKSINIFILIIFSLSGVVGALGKLPPEFMMDWEEILYFFPYSLLTGFLLLGVSTFNYPIKIWQKFSWNNFALNPLNPPSFILFIGLIFTMSGIVGFITAYSLSTGFYKLPAMIFFMGSGVFISGSLGSLYVKKRKT